MGMSLNSLDFLAARFPATVNVKQLSQITSESTQTIRNRLSCGTYPIPSFKLGRKRLFRLLDVAHYLDQACGLSGRVLVPKRGRPSKLEMLRRQELVSSPASIPQSLEIEHAQFLARGGVR